VRLKLIRSPEGMTIEVKFIGVPRHFAWQNTEFIVAATIKGLREMAGGDFQPTQVAFTLARVTDPGEFERFFGCSAVQRISSAFRMRRSPFLWSPEINTCWRRFDPFAKRRRRSATRLTGGSDLQSRTNCRNAAARQSQQTEGRQGAGADRANARAKAG
jgi:hypothetical protein